MSALRVGLTGGIASGKSAAAAHFADLGIEIVDTDQLSRELVTPGQPALAEIVAAFGSGVRRPDGTLDRAALRRIAFADPALRRQLEAILHPRIRAAMVARAERAAGPYVICVIPLLAETGQADLVDRVLVVDLPETLQRARLTARDGLDAGQVDRMLAAQTERTTRNPLADDIIDNSGNPKELRAAVERLHRHYLELARTAHAAGS